jgi:hypothetical protein
MADPIFTILGKKALDVAVEKIEQLLTDAALKQKDGIERCEKFLDVCKEAILGLEQEYDEILVQALNCDNTSTEFKQLLERIDTYLKVDKLRIKLAEAIEGLSYYQSLFETNQKSLFVWPWKKADKEMAINEFSNTLKQLNLYLKNLSEIDLPYRRAGTGVGIKALFAIKEFLENPSPNPNSSLKALAEKYLAERDKEPMFESIKKIRSLIENLRWTFH